MAWSNCTSFASHVTSWPPQENFELTHETLYLAVKLLDHYLVKQTSMREKLQLIGSTAILVASKFEVSSRGLLESAASPFLPLPPQDSGGHLENGPCSRVSAKLKALLGSLTPCLYAPKTDPMEMLTSPSSPLSPGGGGSRLKAVAAELHAINI